MTCAHVLGLIDAGPFADYPRAHLDAAWQHARRCATCGPALELATAMTTNLSALPQLAPPPDLTATVMARITRIEETRAAHDAAADAVVPDIAAPSPARDWSTWATALGAIAAGLAIVISMPHGTATPTAIASPPLVLFKASLIPIPTMTAWAAVLVVSLVLYVVGLFAPLRGRRG